MITDRQLIILQAIVEQVMNKSQLSDDKSEYTQTGPLDLPMELAEFRELDPIKNHAINCSIGPSDDATLNRYDHTLILRLINPVMLNSRLNGHKRCFEQYAPLNITLTNVEYIKLRHINDYLNDLLANISNMVAKAHC